MEKKIIQRGKNQSKDIEYIKKVPLHARERLKRKNMLNAKIFGNSTISP